MRELCRNDDSKMLKFELFEAMKKGNHKSIGEMEFSIKDIIVDDKRMFLAYTKKFLAGKVEVKKCQFLNRYTFLDYI